MSDRLVPLLLTLTIAAIAAVRPPCCCATPGVSMAPCCQANAIQTSTPLPPCCQDGLSCPARPAPCGCTDCPANRPLDPLAGLISEEETASANEATAITPRASLRPPFDQRLPRCAVAVPVSLERPPPDRQALLGVWTI